MAIVFVAGTTAEFIKIGPVLAELSRRGLPYRVWSTAQHVDGVTQTLKDLDVREPDRLLVTSGGRRSVARVSQVPGWLANVVWATSGQFRALKREVGGNGIVLVHGDTFTTVIGAPCRLNAFSPSTNCGIIFFIIVCSFSTGLIVCMLMHSQRETRETRRLAGFLFSSLANSPAIQLSMHAAAPYNSSACCSRASFSG